MTFYMKCIDILYEKNKYINLCLGWTERLFFNEIENVASLKNYITC